MKFGLDPSGGFWETWINGRTPVPRQQLCRQSQAGNEKNLSDGTRVEPMYGMISSIYKHNYKGKLRQKVYLETKGWIITLHAQLQGLNKLQIVKQRVQIS